MISYRYSLSLVRGSPEYVKCNFLARSIFFTCHRRKLCFVSGGKHGSCAGDITKTARRRTRFSRSRPAHRPGSSLASPHASGETGPPGRIVNRSAEAFYPGEPESPLVANAPALLYSDAIIVHMTAGDCRPCSDVEVLFTPVQG